ncbi:DUF3560 domain-containing protein [Streptomyces sp. NPDC001904]|uniref:DUF3560 domain-containing protein n=1 Tax=Streptomyces sp. NPDC001904 TaxID=3154531 RepID=UPI00332142CE
MSDLELANTRAGGTRLIGTAKGDGTAELVHHQGFRWSHRQRLWYVPDSRDTCADERHLQQTAEALRTAGHTVNVTVDNDHRRSFAVAEADRTAAAAARAERFGRWAQRAATEAEAHYAQGQRMLKSIPPGQPILYDHYSANREIRFRERMRRHFELGHAASLNAGEWARRAEHAGHYTQHRQAPGATLRRITDLVASVRRIERQQRAEVLRATEGQGEPESLVDVLAELDRKHHDLTEQIGYWQHVIAEAKTNGARIYGPDDFTAGQFAHVCGRWVEVLKVNLKSLSVASCAARQDVVTREDPGVRPARVPYSSVTGQARPDEVLTEDDIHKA